MKGAKTVKNISQAALDPLETLKEQLIKPMGEETGRELGSFFGAKKLSSSPQELGSEDLRRAREKQNVLNQSTEDDTNSKSTAKEISAQIAFMKKDYVRNDRAISNEQRNIKEEIIELKSEVEGLAKASGVNTKAHLESTPKKAGILDIRHLTAIIRFLRIKAEESKSGKDLVAQRSNAKKTTGMLAWVSGKQMKVHEQGTLTLQG